MKIKDVCDLTGLTSRTIRVYIDECLIKPEYTENYLGRRAFNFSENDIATLKNIAILRKFGFSIPEILKIWVMIPMCHYFPVVQNLQKYLQFLNCILIKKIIL